MKRNVDAHDVHVAIHNIVSAAVALDMKVRMKDVVLTFMAQGNPSKEEISKFVKCCIALRRLGRV